ncbi:MAG: KH domain-containing protein [Candidatus Woesearchaeota archaeon]
MDYSVEIKIPKERVAVLIGRNGETKRELEEYTSSKMDIDSREGDVKVTGSDSLLMYAVKEVVRAIGRGFNPEIAKLLFKQDFVLEVIPLLDYVKHKGHFERIKGRVIGANGKSRETIENLTGTYISVYGKTVSILGRAEEVINSKRAVESLLLGSPHANVYKLLEKNRRLIKEKDAIDW